MTEGLNKVLLLGSLGQDPELRVTQGGQAILKIRMATSESYLDKSNTRQERTEWHSVTVWGKRGEALAKILTKGSTIFVEGGIRTSSYEKNGEKRYSTEIVASNIILAGGKRGASTGDEGNRPPGREAAPYGKSGGGSAKHSMPPETIDAEFEVADDVGSGSDDITFISSITVLPRHIRRRRLWERF